jgi:hypothetical protein
VILIRPATTKCASPRLPPQGRVDLVQGGLVFLGQCLVPPYVFSIGHSSSTGSRSFDLEHCKADAVPWTCNECMWCRPCHLHHRRSHQRYLCLPRQGRNELCRGHFPVNRILKCLLQDFRHDETEQSTIIPLSHYPSVDSSLVRYRYERQPSRSPSMTGSLSCLPQLLLVTTQKRSFLTYRNPLLDPVQGLTRFWANVEQRSRTEEKGVRKVCSSI